MLTVQNYFLQLEEDIYLQSLGLKVYLHLYQNCIELLVLFLPVYNMENLEL
jgi:hypothetical protein